MNGGINMEKPQELNLNDKVVFDDGKSQRTYLVKDIATKDFNNTIWRSGFIYGVMTGGALVLIIIAGIVRPFMS